MREDNKGRDGGIGFTGLLQLVFITLKLLKVINWSWVWVLAPIWITAGLGILVIAVYVTVLILRGKRRTS